MTQETGLFGIDFSRYIADRTKDYTDREWVYSDMDAWLGKTDAPTIYHLNGKPGSGKTAIAARLTQFAARDVEPPQDLENLAPPFLSAVHFCSTRYPGWTNPFEFAQSIASQLASRYPAYRDALTETQLGEGTSRTTNVNVQQNIREVRGGHVVGVVIKVSAPTPEDAFMRVVRSPLKALPSETARKVVLLVDALDESLIYSGKTGIIELLAQLVGDETGVRLLLTSRFEADAAPRFLQSMQVWSSTLSADSAEEQSSKDIKRHVIRVLKPSGIHHALEARLASELTTRAFAERLSEKSQGNFLYVHHLLEMLGRQTGTITQASLDALPMGLDAIYEEFLARLIEPTDAAWRTTYRPVLGTLAVAREPLNEGQLSGIVKLAQADTRIILTELQQLLDVDTSLPETTRRYAIYHRSFADFLLDGQRAGSYWCEGETQHRRITDFCREQAEAWEPETWRDDPDEWDPDDAYILRHWVDHLIDRYALADKAKARRKRAKEIYTRALDEAFQNIQVDRLGDSGAVQADLRATLDIALARSDMVAVLASAGSYRSVVGRFSMMDAVFDAVKGGNFELAEARAGLSGARPPWMAALYHYLAWEATLGKDRAAYERAHEKAARFPQGVTRKLCDAFLAKSSQGWAPQTGAVSDFLADWGLSIASLDADAIQDRLSDLDAALGNLETMVERGEAEGVSMAPFIEEYLGEEVSNLGAALLALAPHDEGQASIDRALAAAVKDPYPAYRDLALVPVGVAAVFMPRVTWARERLQRLLRVAIEDEGVTFTFDLPWTLWKEARHRGLSVPELKGYIEGIEGCYDRWGTAVRAESARAAALFAQGADGEAIGAIHQTAGMDTGYAGYGSVTLLALANQLMSFGAPYMATNAIWGSDHDISLLDGALGLAENVVNLEFRQARVALVHAYLDWWWQDFDDIGAALAAVPQISDYDTRMAYIEHLSARWVWPPDSPNWEGLKALVPLALEGATTLDAVLARLVGARMRQHAFNDDDLREAIRICVTQIATSRPWELGQWAGTAEP
ncbi:MAG: hypothetical protein ACP5JG_18490 [Anaerolineae bacterium]